MKSSEHSKVKYNTISPKNIKGVGLVFIRKDDPINHFVLSITKQLYSLIGFYYTTKSSGKDQVNVILSDVCGIVSSGWMKPFTIDNLVNDPLVTQLSIRKLSDIIGEDGCIDEEATRERNNNFRVSIANVTSLGPETSINEWIKQLVGFEIGQPSSGSTTVELVNRVFFEMGYWEKIKQNSTVSVEGLVEYKRPHILPKTSEGKNHIFHSLGSDLKQLEVNKPGVSNKLLQAYLMDNGVFDHIDHICLPKRTDIEIALRREQSISQHKNFLTSAVTSFVSMLMEDPKFYSTVIDSINNNTLIKDTIDERLKFSVYNLIKSGTNVISNIVGMIENGNISYEKLNEIINDYRKDVFPALKIAKLDINKFPNLDSNQDRIVVIENNPDRSKFKELLHKMRSQILGIKSDIKNCKTPIVNITNLIDNYNTLMMMSSKTEDEMIKPMEEDKSYHSIITTEKCITIPIKFTSGRMVIIPTVGCNLDQFTHSELHELLRSLDAVTNGDDRLDNLRGDIANKIAGCDCT